MQGGIGFRRALDGHVIELCFAHLVDHVGQWRRLRADGMDVHLALRVGGARECVQVRPAAPLLYSG